MISFMFIWSKFYKIKIWEHKILIKKLIIAIKRLEFAINFWFLIFIFPFQQKKLIRISMKLISYLIKNCNANSKYQNSI